MPLMCVSYNPQNRGEVRTAHHVIPTQARQKNAFAGFLQFLSSLCVGLSLSLSDNVHACTCERVSRCTSVYTSALSCASLLVFLFLLCFFLSLCSACLDLLATMSHRSLHCARIPRSFFVSFLQSGILSPFFSLSLSLFQIYAELQLCTYALACALLMLQSVLFFSAYVGASLVRVRVRAYHTCK